MYIKNGDLVQVIAGREKGKTGTVIAVDRRRNRVTIKDVNVVKRHKRPNAVDPDGGIIEKEAPLHASNVLLYSEQKKRGVRVSYRFLGSDGQQYSTRKAALESFAEKPARIEKVRVHLKSGEVF